MKIKRLKSAKGVQPGKLPKLSDYKRTVPPGGLLNPGLRVGGGIGLKVKK